MNFLKKLPEWRIVGYLAIIALGWYLLTVFGTFLAFFADIFLLVILAWILAFIIEPLVDYLNKKGVEKNLAAVLVYLGLAICTMALILVVIPTTVSQLTQLATTVPVFIPQNSVWSTRAEEFIASTLNNSVTFASQLAGAITGMVLVFILSFYFLLSRKEISQLILNLVPDDFAEDYKFLENTLNTTFATFLRVQVLLGLILGIATFVVLAVLRINFALSTAVAAGILGMIPVVGPVIFLIPPVLAALIVSPQKLLITLAILILAAQLVYNVWGPRLLGKALKIHPIVVLISFLIGYKIGGVWGAIFAVPVTGALAIVLKDVLKYWKEEADNGRS